jgi:repressor LexA
VFRGSITRLRKENVKMQALTDKEKRVLDYIVDSTRKNGYPPAVRDIQQALGIKSTSTVHSYIKRLEDKKYLEREAGKSRSLKPVDVSPVSIEDRRSVRIPVVGKVAAGAPILALENTSESIYFPIVKKAHMSGQLYALRVKGESMIEVGIMPGDIIVVHRDAAIRNGEIVVALIDDEATVKTFYQEDGHFRLQPENSTMEPIIVKELSILGKVVSVLRFYREG